MYGTGNSEDTQSAVPSCGAFSVIGETAAGSISIRTGKVTRLPEELLFKKILEEQAGIRGRVFGTEGTPCVEPGGMSIDPGDD